MSVKDHTQLVASWQRCWNTCLQSLIGADYANCPPSYLLEVANLPENLNQICILAEGWFYRTPELKEKLLRALSAHFRDAKAPTNSSGANYKGYNSLIHYLMNGDHQLYTGEFQGETDDDRIQGNGLFLFDTLATMSGVLDGGIQGYNSISDNQNTLLLDLLAGDTVAGAYLHIINYLQAAHVKSVQVTA